MTQPSVAAVRFASGVLLGCALGLLYGFLRPLRPRHTLLSDSLFVLGLLWAWLYLGFAVCGGDLRLGCIAGLLLGIPLWDRGPGRLLAPIFTGFWKLAGKLLAAAAFPVKKILEFAKILFASV